MKQRIDMFGQNVRCKWDEVEQDWYYSITDVVQELTHTDNIKYCINRIKSSCSFFYHNWDLVSKPQVVADKNGVKRRIMTAKTQYIFRIIMELESNYSEPYKLWICAIASDQLESSVKA